MKTVFKNAHVFDPKNNLDQKMDILISGGLIEKIGSSLSGDEEINLEGLHLMPGFIDLHVHFREPGFEYKETIESGARAAAAGGFTTVCMMPNTKPAFDSVFTIQQVMEKCRRAIVRVLPVGAISKNLQGKEMVEYGSLLEAGCVAFSDDGRCVMDTVLVRKSMEYIKDLGVPYIEHCEDHRLTGKGVMHEGRASFELGLPGIPHASEDVIVHRDVELARKTGAHIHLAHLSSRYSVEALKLAKNQGVRATGEVTPHHLLLTDADVEPLNADFKMSPPLRTEEDRQALVQALESGLIEAIATDHAPHSLEEKNFEFEKAPNGCVGLESAFAACMTLVDKKELSLASLVRALTSGPASVFNFKDRGEIAVGKLADFVAVDMKREFEVNKNKTFSKSRNNPLHGMKVRGSVEKTFVGGKLVFDRKRDFA